MIFDEKKNLDFYRNLGVNGRYAKAVDFLQNTDLAALEPGKHEIDGTEVYANVAEYTTIPWEEAKYEAHEHYTDIQYVIEGSEIMTYAPTHEILAFRWRSKQDSMSSSSHGMLISQRQPTDSLLRSKR